MAELKDGRYDVLIVGSGPGGATVAKELSAAKKRVLMLEWGSGRPVTGNFARYLQEQAVPGRSLLFTPQLLGIVRGITTGGSSLYYYATAFPVPHAMLKKYGIDLTAEEKETRRELPIAPLSDTMITPMTARIAESALSLGLGWKRLDKFMYQDRWKPGLPFGYYGDPHDVKWSALMYVREAVGNGAVVLNGARAERIIFEGPRATGVEYVMHGRRCRAYADRVVVAAGGIGSPVLLRKSGIERAGYDFFFDPLVTVCGKAGDVRARADEIPMSMGCHFADEGFVLTDMAVPFALDQLFTVSAFRPHRLFETSRTLRIMVKIRDDLSGRLTDRGGVRKYLTATDRKKLSTGAELAARVLGRAGAKGLYTTWRLAAHPGGTVRVGDLLDADLKVKGRENLYVCDCSVIPEPWGLPPTLTLVCLGKRLARHLALGEKAGAKPSKKTKASPKAKKKAGSVR